MVKEKIAAIVVNAVAGDARVLKMAKSARDQGFDCRVFGLSDTNAAKDLNIEGVPVHLVANPNKSGKRTSFASVISQTKTETANRIIFRRPGIRGVVTKIGTSIPVRAARWTTWQGIYFVRFLRKMTYLIMGIPLKPVRAGDFYDYVSLLDYLNGAMSAKVAEFSPDLIHAHDVNSLGVADHARAMLRAKNKNCLWLYDAHEYLKGLTIVDPQRQESYLVRESKFIHEADHVLTVSPELADRLQQDYQLGEKPDVILNSPQLKDFDPLFPTLKFSLGLKPAVPLVVYSGSTNKHRGVDLVIEALPDMPELHFALICRPRGVYIDSLKARALELGVRDRFHLVPYVPSYKVSSFLRDATAGIFPLRHYGNAEVALPNKMFEYMHAGLPQIVSDTDAMARFVRKNGIGEVFTADNKEEMIQTIKSVLSQRDCYSERNVELSKLYCWETQEQELVKVYRRLLAKLKTLPPIENIVPATR